jgi:tRNA-specific 2-thiouridylase
VPDGDYAGFLATHLPDDHTAFLPGPIITTDGEHVGTHPGYCRFTIGQRKGLPGGFPQPMYVVEIRPDSRSVVIGPETALTSKTIPITALNWLSDPPEAGHEIRLQIRHRGRAAAGEIVRLDDTDLEIRLYGGLRAVTPGQSAAIYRDDQLLGGGRIVAGSELST